MPGLIDAHAHAISRAPEPAEGAEPVWPGTMAHLLAADLREVLRMGFTTIRDVGSFDDAVVEARQAMRYGAFRGPRLLTCGRIVSATAPGGRFFDGMYREADGADEIRKAVREQLRRGADFVKVMTTGARSVELEDPDPAQLTRVEIAALVDEAHRRATGWRPTPRGSPGPRSRSTTGIDTIEHGMYLHQRPDLLERMAAAGQVLVPTLSCFYGVAGLGDRVAPDGPPVPAGNGRGPHSPAPTWSPLLVELAEYNLEQAGLTLRAAHAAGVTIACGHDWKPLYDSALELLRMIHHGLSAARGARRRHRDRRRGARPGRPRRDGRAGQARRPARARRRPAAEPALLRDRDRIWLVLQLGAPVAGARARAGARGSQPSDVSAGRDGSGRNATMREGVSPREQPQADQEARTPMPQSVASPRRRIHNPVQDDAVTFLETSEESGGVRSLAELEVAPGGKVTPHYHLGYTERFRVLEGRLTVQVGDVRRVLGPGEELTVPIGTPHAWSNAGPERTVAHIELRPGQPGFETSIRVVYGLAADGKVLKNGVPRNPLYAALLLDWGETRLSGAAAILERGLRLLARVARRAGVDRKLAARYP